MHQGNVYGSNGHCTSRAFTCMDRETGDKKGEADFMAKDARIPLEQYGVWTYEIFRNDYQLRNHKLGEKKPLPLSSFELQYVPFKVVEFYR